MAKKIVTFRATRTVQKPTVVKFHTRDGKTVSFKAVETVTKQVPVRFAAKKKSE